MPSCSPGRPSPLCCSVHTAQNWLPVQAKMQNKLRCGSPWEAFLLPLGQCFQERTAQARVLLPRQAVGSGGSEEQWTGQAVWGGRAGCAFADTREAAQIQVAEALFFAFLGLPRASVSRGSLPRGLRPLQESQRDSVALSPLFRRGDAAGWVLCGGALRLPGPWMVEAAHRRWARPSAGIPLGCGKMGL